MALNSLVLSTFANICRGLGKNELRFYTAHKPETGSLFLSIPDCNLEMWVSTRHILMTSKDINQSLSLGFSRLKKDKKLTRLYLSPSDFLGAIRIAAALSTYK